jgi:hypothetical protein
MHVSPNDDYGVFMRDGLEVIEPEEEPDMGSALDGGRGFGGGGRGRGGEVMGSIDLGASMVAESNFIFPGQTLQRAPFLGGDAGAGGGGKGEGKQLDVGDGEGGRGRGDGVSKGLGGGVRPPLGRPRSSGLDSLAEEGGPVPYHEPYYPPDTAATQASDNLNNIHKKNEARLRALQGMEGGGGGGGGGGGRDVDQLDQLLKNFLNVTRGDTPQNDEGAPFLDDDDDSYGGRGGGRGGGGGVGGGGGGGVGGGGGGVLSGGGGPGRMDDEYGGGRPDTQQSIMSMDADTRFIRQ